MKNTKGNHVFTLIIIPLLVTAFWEKMLGPIFDIVINGLSDFGSQFVQVILDLIYSRIAWGKYVDFSFYIFVFGISYCLSLVLGIANSEIKDYKKALNLQKKIYSNNTDSKVDLSKEELQEDKKESLETEVNNLVKRTRKNSRIFIVLTIASYFVYFIFILGAQYINDTITKITNNIEIVAPYIEDSEYKALKSSFYSIKCSDDYRSLNDCLNYIAEANGIELQD